jgi:hypothetical protein
MLQTNLVSTSFTHLWHCVFIENLVISAAAQDYGSNRVFMETNEDIAQLNFSAE